MSDIYDAETRMLDDYVGQLLELLESQLDWDNTMVIITADHGENLVEHHLVGHTKCVYQTLAHVPLIVRFPPRLPVGRTSTVVQTLDVPASVIDAIDSKAPATGRGRSFLSLSPSSSTEARPIMIERLRSWSQEQPKDWQTIRSLQRGPWKYITNAKGGEEFYNLAEDPRELDNLLEQQRPLASQFAAGLQDFMDGLELYSLDADEAAPEMDSATEARLRALGYVE